MKTNMKLTKSITWVSLSIVIATVGILAISAPAEPGRSKHHENGGGNGNRDRGGYETFVLDVAIDGRTFAPVGLQDIAPEGEAPNYQPVRGTTFLIDGLILPGYTLPVGPGVVVDEYSDLSIGSWLCRGHFLHSLVAILNDGAFPHAASTQQFFFGEDGIVGEDELITEGNEGGATTHRVISGGTGEFRGMSGEVRQEPLGANNTGFGNYRFTFWIKKKG